MVQRVSEWWKAYTYVVCEWVCEEQKRTNFLVACDVVPTLVWEGIKAFVVEYLILCELFVPVLRRIILIYSRNWVAPR